MKIGLDIGHGTNTRGKGVTKHGKRYKEHTFNSKVAEKLKPELERHGFDVLMAQPPHYAEVDLSARTHEYNQQNVDLVWSIHANAGGGNGRCAFYWHSNSKTKRTAQKLMSLFKDKGYSTHGNGLHPSKASGWTNLHITRESQSDAILTENGFMDDDDDFDLIFGNKQESYINDVVDVHARAICYHFNIDYKKGRDNMFKDVDKNDWAYDDIKEVKEAGLFEGDQDGNFKPDQPMTRKEVAVVINRLRKAVK